MDNPGYVGLTRMRGLDDELRAIANNIANISTTGFRREGVVFAEVLEQAEVDGGAIAMAQPRAHVTSAEQGGLTQTGGALDLAIQGDGFFQVQTPDGARLTRNGAFALDPDGQLVNLQGHQVMDAGGAAIALPPGAVDVAISRDGVVTVAGEPVTEIGVFTAPPESLRRGDGVTYTADGALEPVDNPLVLQGFVEDSNVDPVRELARLIEVQRAYERSQSFLDAEDQRLRDAINTIGRTA